MSQQELRPFQQEALLTLQHSDHVILVAPTGSGKSLIFQEYINKNPKVRALIVSPLNALSRQHGKFFIKEQKQVDLVGPFYGPQVCIASPELLLRDSRIKQWKPNFLVVDEAHCIWEWGEEFRKDFKEVLSLVPGWGIKKSFWCTATLPPHARRRLKKTLPSNTIELGEFKVPAVLSIECKRVFFPNRVEVLYDFCKKRESNLGIIFLNTRMMAQKLGTYFTLWGISNWIYHAGMSLEERVQLEKSLQSAKKGVILATSAFGMGMDLPQICYAVLFQPPFSLLSLMQSLGRTTRVPMRASEGMVFWHEDDFLRYEWMIKGSQDRRDELLKVKEWCEYKGDRQVFLEKYFNS